MASLWWLLLLFLFFLRVLPLWLIWLVEPRTSRSIREEANSPSSSEVTDLSRFLREIMFKMNNLTFDNRHIFLMTILTRLFFFELLVRIFLLVIYLKQVDLERTSIIWWIWIKKQCVRLLNLKYEFNCIGFMPKKRQLKWRVKKWQHSKMMGVKKSMFKLNKFKVKKNWLIYLLTKFIYVLIYL